MAELMPTAAWKDRRITVPVRSAMSRATANAVRLSSRSTTWAASRARSAPPGMQMPTSAEIRAGASLTPVPGKGHEMPVTLQPADNGRLVVRLEFPMNLVRYRPGTRQWPWPCPGGRR